MPNGKPGDHPLTDIVQHRMDIFTSDADEIVRTLACDLAGAELSTFLYGLYRDKNTIRSAGLPGSLPLPEFEQFLRQVLELIWQGPKRARGTILKERRKWLDDRLASGEAVRTRRSRPPRV